MSLKANRKQHTKGKVCKEDLVNITVHNVQNSLYNVNNRVLSTTVFTQYSLISAIT